MTVLSQRTESARESASFGHDRMQKHLLYAGVITAIALLAGAHGLLPVFRSHLMAYLNVAETRFGLMFGVSAITSLAGVLVGGALNDRWGPRRVIRIGLIGLGSAMWLLAIAGARYPVFLVVSGLTGFFSAPLFIAISDYLGKLFPRHRRRVIALNLASTSIGGILFPLIAEGLLFLSARNDAVTFRHILHIPFFVTGSVILLCSRIYRKRTPPSGRASAPPAAVPWAQWPLRRLPPRTFLLAMLIALHGVADWMLYLWMPRFLESESFPAAPIPPGLALSGYALAYLLARGTLGLMPDRFGKRSFMIWPGLVGGSIVLAGIVSRSYLLTIGGYVLGAFCWSIEYPVFVSTLMQVERKRFGMCMAVAGVLGGGIGFAAAAMMGALTEHMPGERMWLIMIVPALFFVLIGMGGGLWLLTDRSAAENPPTPVRPDGGRPG